MTAVTPPNVHQLARLADAVDPDGPDSPGGRFLRLIAEDVEQYTAEEVAEYGDDLDDLAHEIADSCVPVYTHERWMTFVDLAAYTEDTAEIAADVDDLTQLAGIALYLIGKRLAAALIEDRTGEE